MLRIPFMSVACLIGIWMCLSHSSRGEDGVSTEYFESKVRPILAQRCYECHSGAAKKVEANLRLDHRSFLLSGGDSGPVISTDAANATNDSLLLQAVRYEGYEMPPSGKLPREEIEVLEKWVCVWSAVAR